MKLEHLLELRNYDLNTLRYKYIIGDSDIDTGVKYLKLNNLTRIRKEKLLPCHFYYSGNSLQMIYVNDKTLLESLNTEEIFKAYGEGEILKSRTGKISKLHVYAELGFAISVNNEKIEFMEIFPPVSIEKYKEDVYQEVII